MSDLQLALNRGLLPKGSLIIADNVLIPGAPDYRDWLIPSTREKENLHWLRSLTGGFPAIVAGILDWNFNLASRNLKTVNMNLDNFDLNAVTEEATINYNSISMTSLNKTASTTRLWSRVYTNSIEYVPWLPDEVVVTEVL